MTLLFMDGMDPYAAKNDLLEKWTTVPASANVTINTTGGRFGEGSLQITEDDVGPTVVVTASNEIIIGWSFKVSALSFTDVLLKIQNTSNIIGTVQLTTTGRLDYYRGDSVTLLGSTPTGVVSAATWHRIELRVIVNDTTGQVEIKVDTVQQLNLTSQDTKPGSDTTVDTIGWFGIDTATNNIDDPTVNDTNGSFNNTFLGDVRIKALVPDVDGAVQFTRSSGANNFEMVDDAVPGIHDSDSTFNESSTIGHEDFYGTVAMPTNPASILAVNVRAVAKKTDAGTRTLRAKCLSSATEGNGSTIALTTTYKAVEGIFETDPDTSVAWLEAGVNAMQIGQEIMA